MNPLPPRPIPVGAAPASADGGSSAATEFSFALKSITQMAKTTAEVLKSTCRNRLKPPHPDKLRLDRMSLCLDLRQMARDTSYATGVENCAALKQLVLWMKKRERGAEDDERQTSDLPCIEEMQQQFVLLSDRVRVAFAKQPYCVRWAEASGTVIMADIFVDPQFYRGCSDFLYLFQQCATKTMCEAVVEGMGSVWAKCTDPARCKI